MPAQRHQVPDQFRRIAAGALRLQHGDVAAERDDRRRAAPPASPSSFTCGKDHAGRGDGRDGHGKTESFVFRLVVRSGDARSAEARGATVELRSGQRLLKSLRLSADAVTAIQEKPGNLSADAYAIYLLRFAFTEP